MDYSKLLDERQAAYEINDRDKLTRLNAEIFNHDFAKKPKSIDEIFAAAKKKNKPH